MIDFSGYDFLDFGSGKGGCMAFAKHQLGGKRGLGFDMCPKKIKILKAKKIRCIKADVTKLNIPKKVVRFVTMSHFLEHLNSIEDVQKVLRSAVRSSKEFVFIEGPSFDHDALLQSKGLRFFWSHWSGHKTHVTTQQLIKIFNGFGIKSYTLFVGGLINSSVSPNLHPLNAPINSFEYDINKHPPKPSVVLDKKIYSYFHLYGWLTEKVDKKKIIRASKRLVKVINQ